MILFWSSNKINMFIFWGYAGWSRTQLLGEIARGGWGMCRIYIDSINNPSDIWNKIYNSGNSIFAPLTEFSEKYK